MCAAVRGPRPVSYANSDGSRSEFLSEAAFCALFRQSTPENRAARMLTNAREALAVLVETVPRQSSFAFPAGGTFVFDQNGPNTGMPGFAVEDGRVI